MKNSFLFSFLFFLGLFIFNSCDFSKHVTCLPPAPQNVLSESLNSLEENPSPAFEIVDAIPRLWWTIWEDPLLDELIQNVLASNPTSVTAQRKISLAFSIAKQAFSKRWPEIHMNTDFFHLDLSRTGIFSIDRLPTTSYSYNQIQWFFNFLFDLDLWGEKKNLYLAALQDVQIAYADEAMAKLSLSLTTADNYFRLRFAINRQNVLEEIIDTQNQISDLINSRIDYGVDDKNAQRMALSQKREWESRINQAEMDIANYKNQLDALIGWKWNFKVDALRPEDNSLMTFPLPESILLNLISHRPDVFAERCRIEQAAKKIGAAKAGFYPNINLLALWGIDSVFPKFYFDKKSLGDLAGPALRLPLFDAGFLKANLEAKEIEYCMAIDAYETAILNAVKEVVQQINFLKISYEKFHHLQEKNQFSKEIYLNSKLLVEHNVCSLLDLLEKKTSYLETCLDLLNTQEDHLHGILLLFKALGGGFTDG